MLFGNNLDTCCLTREDGAEAPLTRGVLSCWKRLASSASASFDTALDVLEAFPILLVKSTALSWVGRVAGYNEAFGYISTDCELRDM